MFNVCGGGGGGDGDELVWGVSLNLLDNGLYTDVCGCATFFWFVDSEAKAKPRRVTC